MTTTGLWAMFWKECRENGLWAMLSGLGLSLGLAFAIHQEHSQRLGYVWEDAALVLTIGAPFAALILGLLQILPELRRDQWAFLVHRPTSRTALFRGKALPGVTLYLLATVLPLIGLILWNGPDGREAAPLDWRFTLGAVAAILSGLPFYFAGLLTALRPARWYGSRALPIPAALLAPLAANWQMEFWQVALSCTLVTAALAAAAWGSFLTSGQYAGQPRPARFALGLTLFAGLAGAIIGLTALGYTAYQSAFASKQMRLQTTTYQIDTRGKIVRVTYLPEGDARYADLNGRPMPPKYPFPSSRPGYGVQFLDFVPAVTPFGPGSEQQRQYNKPTRYAAPMYTFLYHFEDTAWFYLYDLNQAVGYSLRTHRIVGYLGPRGFASSANDAGSFAEPILSIQPLNSQRGLLHFAHSVISFDTRQQEVKPLWPPSGRAKIDGVAYASQSGSEQQTLSPSTIGDALVIAADRQFHLFTGTGIPLLTVPYAAEAARYPFVLVGTAPLTPGKMPPPARFFFWYCQNGFGAQSWADSKVVALSSSGRVVQTATLPALQTPPHYQTPIAPGLLTPPAADAFGLGLLLRDHWFGNEAQKKNWDTLADPSLRGLLLLSILTGLASALLAYFLSRRLGDTLRGRLAWALGTFWLGGYGVLLLLALRPWPARVPCPNCGRLRVVDHDACERCGAAFARPKRDGTEIFDVVEGREEATR